MGILDNLLKDMEDAGKEDEKKTGKKSALSTLKETFPSDTQLQERKSNINKGAEGVTDYLAEKGYPTAGAVAGTAASLYSDMVPGSQDEYMDSLASSGSMGTVENKVGKLGKMAMPEAKAAAAKGGIVEARETLQRVTANPVPSQEALRSRWNGLSGEVRDEWGNDARGYIADQLKQDARIRAEAANKLEALKNEVRSNPTPADLSSSYKQVDTSKRRLMDDSKVFNEPSMVANVDSGKIADKAKVVEDKVPEVMIPKFADFDGMTFQQKQIARKEEADIQALRDRMSGKRK